MSVPAALARRLVPHVGAGAAFTPVGGGCIARAMRVEVPRGVFFLKWGADDVARTFAAEADGLAALREAGMPLVVPAAVAHAGATPEAPGFLLLEWIDEGAATPAFWERLGEGLAALHRHTGPAYGFHGDNFIGRLAQANAWHDRWPDFFAAHRLEPQAERARRGGHWQAAWDAPFAALLAALPEVLPARPVPSLVHGDLWRGNVLATAEGRPALIDPAVYFGDRETDLAMTALFGGFAPAFYDAYQAAWPLEPGHAERRDVYNLYHVLNHLNHFGGSYAGQVDALLRRWG